MERIRYGGIIAGWPEINAVTDVLSGQNWASGEKVTEFEHQVAAFQGRRRALFVNSGTSALLLSMTTLKPGSRIAMPALQFPTLYSTAKWNRHHPVLVDIDDSLNMDPEKLLEVADRVDAVAFVHMAGNPANIDQVRKICYDHELTLLEDICEAFGSKALGVHAGNFGFAAAASTHGAHHICTGEGGIVFTDSEAAYQKMRRIRDWGRAYGTEDIEGYYPGYVFSELGLNLHASDIAAVLGIEQLKRIGHFTQRRQENWALLYGLLDGVTEVRVPEIGWGCEPSWFAFPMLVPEGSRTAFIRYLENANIECRTVVAGNLPRQPICDGDPADFPVADKWFYRGLWISAHPRITEDQIRYTAKTIRGFW